MSNSSELANNHETQLLQRIAELEQQVQQQHTEIAHLKIYQQFLDAMPIPIQIYHPDGFMVTMNSASETFWQATRQQTAGVFNIICEPQFQEQGIPALFQQALDGHVVQTPPIVLDTSQVDIDHLNDVKQRVVTSYFPLADETSSVQYIGAINQDVSAKIQQQNNIKQMETRLQEHQKLFEDLIEHLPSAVTIKDTEGHIIIVNQQFKDLFGMTREDLIGKTSHDLLSQDDADIVWQTEQHVMETRKPTVIEERIHIAGEEHLFIASKFPVYNQLGHVYAVGSVKTDITEQRRAEEQLYLTQFAVDSLSDSVFLIGRDSSLHYVNDAMCTSLGYTRDELLTMGVFDIDPIFPISQWNDLWDEIRQKTSTTLYTRHQHKNGISFPVEVRITFFSYQGQEYIYVFARDITERQKTEQQMQCYAAIIEAGIDGVAMAAPDNTVLMVNKAFRQMIGASLDVDAISINMDSAHPEWARRIVVEEGIPSAIRDGIWVGETALVHWQTGNEFPVSQVIVAHRLADGTLDFISTIIRDISAVKQAEIERTALQQQVIDAQRQALKELSTPLIPLSRHVVLMPLIGSIDSYRAEQVMTTLLEGIAQNKAEIAILDITGVAVVDTHVANALIQAAQAVQLLGAQVIITGIGPVMAQTMVHLGIDLSSIVTRGSLQKAVAEALHNT